MRFLVSFILFCCAATLGTAQASLPSTEGLAADRQAYSEAVEAIDKGRWTEYRQLRPGLDNYPLAIYLDYYQLTRQPKPVRASEARRFVDLSADTPLPNRFLSNYLTRAGRERRWDDFLTVKPDEPNSVELKCYYFRAKLGTGDPLAAWEGAERLWVHGKSRPKECDPLFDAWLKAGQLSDEVVWARLMKAFEARQGSLMKYVARKGTTELAPWSERALAVYGSPSKMRSVTLPAGDPCSAEIAAHGLVYLARYNPGMALDYWYSYQDELTFSDEQSHQVEYEIALRTLFAETESNMAWLPGALARLKEDKLVEIRLRLALRESDWTAVASHLPLLSAEGREQEGWRYWQARVLQEEGKKEEAEAILTVLAGERDFYGFMAADALSKPYAFNHESLVLESARTKPLQTLPGVQRVGEFYHHEEQRNAHSEWYKMLSDAEDAEAKQALAQLAAEQGWHSLAINAAAKAKAWDALDWRFPTPHQEVFSHHATVQRVSPTELMAIARRESAFFPEARSPVGARGLMQVMPATGKQVAASLGRPHTRADLYEVEHNVLLGSAYYRQLLDRFDGNRIFALAAYNAGPHRVDRWRRTSGETLPVDAWIETIPFKETRNYVKNVLSYNVVFQYLLGDTHALLTEAEKSAVY
ncbi:lytic transglycosylase [Halioglobus japonicus]|uniref:Murein transglycosylase n=3 Tax=Halioglobus japonicus TaxID=930805 RepID=A0AAP8MFQ3_9GAMM|nr:transglycosylase SLT domain-containing protein [Halioglobus japonicus]PLW86692.1 murein transglycosylase [Halioglobus japonicus]GHD11555.1 lytic transglycosylase [Halioglobus japonicus]